MKPKKHDIEPTPIKTFNYINDLDEKLNLDLSGLDTSKNSVYSVVDDYFEKLCYECGMTELPDIVVQGTYQELKRFIEIFIILGRS